MSWGLLKGLGTGMAQTGTRVSAFAEDMAKEQWRQRFQQQQLQENRQYQKEVTAEDREYKDGLLKQAQDREDSQRAVRSEEMVDPETGELMTIAYNANDEVIKKEVKRAPSKLVDEERNGMLMQRDPETNKLTPVQSGNTQRQYLNPLTSENIKAINSDLSAPMRKDMTLADDTALAAHQAEIESLRQRRDQILGNQGGTHPMNGRPILNNPDGTFSTEESITVEVDDLNGGRPTNIPSIWGGKRLSEREAIQQAISSGQKFDSYDTIDQAVSAAKARSNSLGSYSPDGAQKPLPMPKSASQFVVGQVYETPRGMARYIGNGNFEAVR
jgi:hypothetical protein